MSKHFLCCMTHAAWALLVPPNKIENIKWSAEMTLRLLRIKRYFRHHTPGLIPRLNIEFQIQAWFNLSQFKLNHLTYVLPLPGKLISSKNGNWCSVPSFFSKAHEELLPRCTSPKLKDSKWLWILRVVNRITNVEHNNSGLRTLLPNIFFDLGDFA